MTRQYIALGLAFCLLLTSIAFSGENKNKPLTRFKGVGKKIALTFDDGPDKNTIGIVELIKANGGKATFFVKGNLVEKHPEIAKKIIAEGFEIGNHTWTHMRLPDMKGGIDTIREDIKKCQDIVTKTTGFTPVLFRAPCLGFTKDVWTVINEMNLPAVNCDFDTRDWSKKTTTEMVVEKFKTSLKPGSIVLLHSNRAITAAAMPEIIRFVKEQGYEMLTVSELIAAAKEKADK